VGLPPGGAAGPVGGVIGSVVANRLYKQ
jgi:hypothetical protein